MPDAGEAKPAAPAKLRGLALIQDVKKKREEAKIQAAELAKKEAEAKEAAAKAKAAGDDDAAAKAKAAEDAKAERARFEGKIDALATKLDELLKALTA